MNTVKIHLFHSFLFFFQTYLKGLLNCILLRSNAFLKTVDNSCDLKGSDDDIQIIDDDYDEIFNNMETVEEASPRKRHKLE